jgi:dolichol-phosphate mannosyltransferase
MVGSMVALERRTPESEKMISVILPTYNEAENIKRIIPAIAKVFRASGIKGEVIVVDDNSPDGTAEVAASLKESHPVKVLIRKVDRGLSRSVIEGFGLSDGEICVVMDADLSHPVEKIPEMIQPILDGKCDATVGSRYVRGGGADTWPLIRKVISRGAGLLAKGVTTLSDPTSGFMAVRKSKLEKVVLDPLGWKIVLEVVVKTKAKVLDIPIIFADREIGESKLGFRAQIDYIRHLCRLYKYRYHSLLEFIKFCVVGLTGLIIDTMVLVSLVNYASLDPRFAAVFAFTVAVTWNYMFNRLWAFESGRAVPISRSYVLFVSVCLGGLVVRITVMHILIEYAGMGIKTWYILASFMGIAAATVFNFVGSRYIAFRKSCKRDGEHD